LGFPRPEACGAGNPFRGSGQQDGVVGLRQELCLRVVGKSNQRDSSVVCQIRCRKGVGRRATGGDADDCIADGKVRKVPGDAVFPVFDISGHVDTCEQATCHMNPHLPDRDGTCGPEFLGIRIRCQSRRPRTHAMQAAIRPDCIGHGRCGGAELRQGLLDGIDSLHLGREQITRRPHRLRVNGGCVPVQLFRGGSRRVFPLHLQ